MDFWEEYIYMFLIFWIQPTKSVKDVGGKQVGQSKKAAVVADDPDINFF